MLWITRFRRFGPTVALAVCLAAGSGLAASADEPHFSSGPEVGEKVPEFELPDQHGNPRTLENLAGPNGLLLLFYRTVDW